MYYNNIQVAGLGTVNMLMGVIETNNISGLRELA